MNTLQQLKQTVEAADTKVQPQSANSADLDTSAIEVAENEGWPVRPDRIVPKLASHSN